MYWRASRWYDWTRFTWKLFSIPVIHLTWLDETVLNCVKCIINFSAMLCILENGALQKKAYLCIDWTGLNSAKLLSNTCSTTNNICVAMVNSSHPKLMHNQFRDALPLRKRCIAKGCTYVYFGQSGDGYVWSGFNSFEMLSITCRTTSIKCSNDGQLTPKNFLTLSRGPLHPWN